MDETQRICQVISNFYNNRQGSFLLDFVNNFEMHTLKIAVFIVNFRIYGHDIEFESICTSLFNFFCKFRPLGQAIAIDARNDRNGTYSLGFLD